MEFDIEKFVDSLTLLTFDYNSHLWIDERQSSRFS